jgi:hypothetical protein
VQDVTAPNGYFKVLDEHSLPEDHPALHMGPPKENKEVPIFAALSKLKESKAKKRSRSRSPAKGDDKRSKQARGAAPG